MTKVTGDLKGYSQFALKRALDAHCGPVEDAKATRDGALLIVTTDRYQTEDLLKVKSLGGFHAKVALSEKVKSVMAACRSDDLTGLTNAELLEELKAQGVCRVERLRSRNAAEWGPNPTIKLSFYGKEIPQNLRCGYLRVPVDPWVSPPMLCSNCWDVGTHGRRDCSRRTPKCGRCGDDRHKADDFVIRPRDCDKCATSASRSSHLL